MKNGFPTVWLLALVNAIALSASPMMMLIGSIIGARLASSEQLATLPIALLVVGTADYAPIEEECSQLGIDWKDLYFLRGERVLRELDVPGFLTAVVNL